MNWLVILTSMVVAHDLLGRPGTINHALAFLISAMCGWLLVDVVQKRI